jgi:hypothetical protein
MGDRSNIAVDFGGKRKVYLYSHWDGRDIALSLRDVLRAGKRLDDAQYFTRILFDKIVGKSQGSETGYGISPFICDNEHAVLVVDIGSRMVYQEGDVTKNWTFSDYAVMSDGQARDSMR